MCIILLYMRMAVQLNQAPNMKEEGLVNYLRVKLWSARQINCRDAKQDALQSLFHPIHKLYMIKDSTFVLYPCQSSFHHPIEHSSYFRQSRSYTAVAI